MKKYILIGTILLSMLLFAACGEEKPLADRVIENLEDCMGAREVTEEEYEELKEKERINPVFYFQSLRTDNTYFTCKESDLPQVNMGLSLIAEEELEVTSAIMYRCDNRVDDDITYMEVSLYEFISKAQAEKYMEHSRDICEKHYERIKVDNTSQEHYPNDRKLGKEEGEDFIYVIIDYRVEGTYVEEMYSFFDGNQVLEVIYCGHEDNEIYPKYQKFLKKMKFEGLKDIELEYAEPQS